MSEDNKEVEREESTANVNTDQNSNDQLEEKSSDSEFDRAVEATKAAKKKTAKKKASKKTSKKTAKTTAKAKSPVEDLDLSEDQEAVLAAIQRGQTLRAAAIAVLKRAENYKEEALQKKLPSAMKKVKQGQLIEAIKKLV